MNVCGDFKGLPHSTDKTTLIVNVKIKVIKQIDTAVVMVVRVTISREIKCDQEYIHS